MWMAEADDGDLECRRGWQIEPSAVGTLPPGATLEAALGSLSFVCGDGSADKRLEFLVEHFPKAMQQELLARPGYAFRAEVEKRTYLVLFLACDKGRAAVEERARVVAEVLGKFCPVIALPRILRRAGDKQ